MDTQYSWKFIGTIEYDLSYYITSKRSTTVLLNWRFLLLSFYELEVDWNFPHTDVI